METSFGIGCDERREKRHAGPAAILGQSRRTHNQVAAMFCVLNSTLARGAREETAASRRPSSLALRASMSAPCTFATSDIGFRNRPAAGEMDLTAAAGARR